MSLDSAVPVRGTRPRNRRALIVRAATDLFYRLGYDHVGMGDIADAVAIGPSALYRHFRGKQQLLHAVISEGLLPVRTVIAEVDLADRGSALPAIARLALEHRELGVLMQREARHVMPADLTHLRAQMRDIGATLSDRVHAARPELNPAAADLLAWAMIATVASTSFHHLEPSRPDYEDLLTELLGLVLDTDIPADFADGPRPRLARGVLPHSRREALLTQAVRMFAIQGYTGVGMQDIGAAVGMTGPSVYSHFDSKLELLVTALHRGTATLYTNLAASQANATSASDALRRLAGAYLAFTIDHHNLVDLLITETEHLPDDERHRTRQAQHVYINEWVHLLRDVHPDLDPTAARIRVQATLAVANDVARTPHLRRIPDVPQVVNRICARLLRLP